MRKEPRWVKVFLAGLGRSGNVRLAAAEAGVDFSTAYQRRKRHGDFAERWEGVLREHASRSAQAEREDEETPPPASLVPLPPPAFRRPLGAGGTSKPASPIASQQGGADLVTRPDGKVIRGSDARWGKRAEEAFLLELTVSANVRRAAEAAGFSTTAVYARRMKDRRFAAAWDAAMETGKARVQAFLVEAATRTFDPDELPVGDDREMQKVSISEAINIAKLKGGPSTSLGTNGKWGANGEDDDFDAWPITREEYEAAKQRIIDRIQRLRDNMAADGWWEDDDGQLIPPGYARVEG